VWPNAAGRPGDALVLTKALGTGIITTAMKEDAAPREAVDAALRAMTTLNRRAAEIAKEVGEVHACTDVTGFGLLGHLREMVEGAKLSARVYAEKVPVLPRARELAEADYAPGGTERNLAHVAPIVEWEGAIDQAMRLVLADAQTAGGLLLALPQEKAEVLVSRLKDEGLHDATIIGELTGGQPGRIVVA